jgi:hypothetical protein
VADVACGLALFSGRQGVDEHRSVIVEKGHEGEAGRSSEPLQQLAAAGSVQRLLIAVLVDGDVGGDEVAVEDRLDVSGPDKPIEFLAPASPGGVKDDEDGAVIRGSLGVRENGIGRRRRLRGESGQRKHGDGGAQHSWQQQPHREMILPIGDARYRTR